MKVCDNYFLKLFLKKTEFRFFKYGLENMGYNMN